MKYEQTEAYRKYQREWHKADRAKKKAAGDPLYAQRLEENRKYYADNKERLSECRRQYREKNKEIIAEKKKIYYQQNKEKASLSGRAHFQRRKSEIQAARRERYKTDPQFRLAYLIRNRLRTAIIKNGGTGKKPNSAVKSLGCSIAELKEYIATKFKEGMSWENHGEWHLDHIRPLDSFDLLGKAQYEAACHYTNLQPLWAAENIAKKNKLPPDVRLQRLAA